MIYLVDGQEFSFDYVELVEHYKGFINMSNSEFMDNIDQALHFAIFICYLKNIPTYLCLSDLGIIHELAHLKQGYNVTSLDSIRELFKRQLFIS